MKITVRNPTEGVYPATADYVHAVEVTDAQRLLFVAGTMGLETDGSPGDGLERQLELIWSNIRRVLAEAGMTVDNIVRITSYLTDPSYADANAASRVEALAGRAVPTTAIVVQTLDPAWLLEIEIVAAD